jgi:hypothetical protein
MVSHMSDRQIERLERGRKLPARGKFLAGRESYDEHGNLLPTGTVPASDRRGQPAEGALTAHPDEQHPPTPLAPVTPDPYGGTVSSTHAAPPKPDTEAEEHARHDEPGR